MREQAIYSLINSVIMVSEKFISKVKTGKARSKETFSDLLKLKIEAELVKKILMNDERGEM